MSTILKSLKKLEQEKEATRYPVQSTTYAGLGTLMGSGGSSQWTRRTWIRRMGVAVLILGLCTTTIYFYQQSRRQLSSSTSWSEDGPTPVGKIAQGAIEQSGKRNPTDTNGRQISKTGETSRQKIKTPDQRPAVDPSPVQRVPTHRNEPRLTESPPSISASPATKTRRSPKQAVRPADQPDQTEMIPQEIPKTVPEQSGPPITASRQEKGGFKGKAANSAMPAQRSPVRSPEDNYSELPPLNDGRLKVHAIVWSDGKEDRMAVINTQILHEGDQVAGFDVIAIRQDDVVVRGDGGGMYRVLFGRP